MVPRFVEVMLGKRVTRRGSNHWNSEEKTSKNKARSTFWLSTCYLNTEHNSIQIVDFAEKVVWLPKVAPK
jgi:hypothetical protein